MILFLLGFVVAVVVLLVIPLFKEKTFFFHWSDLQFLAHKSALQMLCTEFSSALYILS